MSRRNSTPVAAVLAAPLLLAGFGVASPASAIATSTHELASEVAPPLTLKQSTRVGNANGQALVRYNFWNSSNGPITLTKASTQFADWNDASGNKINPPIGYVLQPNALYQVYIGVDQQSDLLNPNANADLVFTGSDGIYTAHAQTAVRDGGSQIVVQARASFYGPESDNQSALVAADSPGWVTHPDGDGLFDCEAGGGPVTIYVYSFPCKD